MMSARAGVFTRSGRFAGTADSPALGIDVRGVRAEALLDAWVDAERDAAEALEHWQAADSDARAVAYVGYTAALDREQQAAVVLAAAAEARR